MSSALLRPQTDKRPHSRRGAESPKNAIQISGSGTASRPGIRYPILNPTPPSAPFGLEQPAEIKHRRRASHNSITSFADGVGNLNRWSQSTVSSKSSATTRRNSFARRLSGSFGSLAAYTSSSPQKNAFSKSSSPVRATFKADSKGIQGAVSSSQPPRLPPVMASPLLTQQSERMRTPPLVLPTTPNNIDLAPSATYMPGGGDYFGETWSGYSPVKTQKVSERSPAKTSYTASPAGDRIIPGAKNSFANPSPPRGGSSSKTYQALYEAQKSGSPPKSRDTVRGDGQGKDNTEEHKSSPGQGRRRKPASQKAMLAKALEKANYAVVLDNAQNFEGAMGAYQDACNLLQQVMMRSSGDEDKKKLDTIRATYIARIKELRTTEGGMQVLTDKALPDVPKTSERRDTAELFSPLPEDDDDDEGLKNTRIEQAQPEDSLLQANQGPSQQISRDQLPPRRQSLVTRNPSHENVSRNNDQSQQLAIPKQPVNASMLAVPVEKNYVPQPLSPRRAYSPSKQSPTRESSRSPKPPSEATHPGHVRQETAESTSWLDTIEESGGSSNNSIHSRNSFQALRRKPIRRGSGDTEAEFDAALDAAVEAAYDEGYEPASDYENQFDHQPLTFGMNMNAPTYRQNVDIAKQRVRDIEGEQASAFGDLERDDKSLLEHPSTWRSSNIGPGMDDEDEAAAAAVAAAAAAEEEKLLDDISRDWVMEDHVLDNQNKSSVPRGSDSSAFSGRTWGSSVGSMPATSASITPLSTVAETSSLPELPGVPPQKSLAPQPTSLAAKKPSADFRPEILPPPPPPIPKSPPSGPLMSGLPSPGVRERRLSGHKQVKQLKIDTGAKLPPNVPAPKTQPLLKLGSLASEQVSEPPKSATVPRDGQLDPPTSSYNKTFFLNSNPGTHGSPFPTASPSDPGSGLSESAIMASKPRELIEKPPSSPIRPGTKNGHRVLKKAPSASSLKSMGKTTPTPPADESPSTPLTKSFSNVSLQRGQVPSVPDLPTSPINNFIKIGNSTGSLSFFDSEIHSGSAPGSPDPNMENAPVPLEPCPESFLLRPFWLMRAIFQTVANARGGYISTRLFVPRDIWRVKNVKLKNIEEKVAACDLLVAALLNLSRIDTLDADKMFDQLQAFELTLDSVQAQLGKKLGAEVGTQGVNALFKGDLTSDDPGTANELLSAKSTNKSYFGLKRLGRKSSNAPGLASAAGDKGSSKETIRENLTIKSLPMTSKISTRFPKREVHKIVGIGPHAHYMSALARLCDAVQVVDQIARQVEDPGVKSSSKAHVGIQLSVRHAAEFFAFYICRFVLTDISLMLDKFIKRGSEWVNS